MRSYQFQRLFVAAVLAIGAGAATAGENCTLKQLASLDMADRSDVVVPFTIDGTQTKMLVDTGGFITSIFSDTAARLGLHATRQLNADEGMIDVRGQTATELVDIPDVVLGAMHGHNLTFMWLPRRHPNAEIDGVLAPDLLRRYDVDFDFANRKLKLFSPDHCTGHVVYWASAYDSVPVTLNGQHIDIAIQLDGKEIRAIIDTGASITLLSRNSAYQLFGLDENSPGVETIPGSTDTSFIRYRYRFKQLSFGAVQISNPVVVFLPDDMAHRARLAARNIAGDPTFATKVDIPPMIVGMDILRKLHLYVAYHEGRIYLTGADAGVAATSSAAAAAVAR